jgi:hypothetical protein
VCEVCDVDYVSYLITNYNNKHPAVDKASCVKDPDSVSCLDNCVNCESDPVLCDICDDRYVDCS